MEEKIIMRKGKWELIEHHGEKWWRKNNYYRKLEPWIIHPLLIDIVDLIHDLFAYCEKKDILSKYFIVGFFLSVLYLACSIWVSQLKITIILAIVAVIWWSILGIPASIFIAGGLILGIPTILFRTIAEMLFSRTITMKCPNCDGKGKVSVPFFDTGENIETNCDVCFGLGKTDIKTWK